MMRTIIGWDAAVQAPKIGLARARLVDGVCVLQEAVRCSAVRSPLSVLTNWVRDVEDELLLAIDAPLGWPLALARNLAPHRAGGALGASANEMFRRCTDVVCKATTGKTPLDVGADKLARAAHATLALVADLRRATGRNLPLAWNFASALGPGAIVEVYPAGTLAALGLSHDDGEVARGELIDRLAERKLLRVDDAVRASVVGSEHVLDAVVACLAGSDFLAGRCIAPGDDDRETAAAEGWIWCRARTVSAP